MTDGWTDWLQPRSLLAQGTRHPVTDIIGARTSLNEHWRALESIGEMILMESLVSVDQDRFKTDSRPSKMRVKVND